MDKKFEFSTLLGIVASLVMVLVAIVSGGTNDILSFIDVPSLLIVVGGTFFVTCASYTIADVMRAISISSLTIIYKNNDKKRIATICVTLADQAKKEGILSLQKTENVYGRMNEFFSKYLGLVIDGLNINDVEKLMAKEIFSIKERHKKAIEILRKAAEVAPAMGLVGTLIGLVQMLGTLSDPSKIGSAMALALLTTLYGAVTCYVILNPLANKLEKNSKDEMEILKIFGEAVLGIARQDSAMKLEMKLNANLSPEDRVTIYS